ncbi:MAG: hypothetical protein FWB86_00040 [Treponema sp.]|nr:hypothetical protein [Treponema sp.]MCL2251559.1 hypothetical protein [Treponema sp.]
MNKDDITLNNAVTGISKLKDKAILLGWIFGLLILISFIWIITQSVQSYYLLRTVNNVLISNNDSRRLSASLNQDLIEKRSGNANLLGYWYTMHNSSDYMFVFTVFQDGIMLPLGAIVAPNGKVSEILPLSAHASYVFDTLPKSILQIYINRIESMMHTFLTNSVSIEGSTK